MHIRDIVSSLDLTAQPCSSDGTGNVGANGNGGGTKDIIDGLFEALLSIYPAFKQAWPTQSIIDDAKNQWLLAFQQARLNDVELIKEGLKKARLSTSNFVPSVGQFIEMCRPTKEIKWQSETRDHEMVNKFALESDEHKEKRRANGRSALNDILRSLKK